MRTAPFLFLLACDGLSWGPPTAPVSEGGRLMTVSGASAQLDSVAMSDDGQKFFAVIGATTWCSFLADDGYMEMDTSADTEVEVHDIYAYTPLVSTNTGLALINEAGTTTTYLALDGIVDARFRESGSVVRTSDGLLRWYDADSVSDVVNVGSCAALEFDRVGDTAWLACSESVTRVQGASPVEFPIAGGAARIAWSEFAATVAAVSGDYRTVHGLDAEGAELWTLDAGAPVLDIVAVADTSVFAAVLEHADGNEIVLLDADSGAIVDRLDADGTRLKAAHDNARLVLLGGYTTWVYDVE